MVGRQEILTQCNKADQQRGHQTPLSIVHKEPKPQPLLCLASRLALLSLTISFGEQSRALGPGKVVQDILNDKPTLGDDNRFSTIYRGDGDHGGLSQRVDFLELGRGEEGFLVAVEDLEFVVHIEFLEEPSYTLGTGLFEPWQLVLCCYRYWDWGTHQ